MKTIIVGESTAVSELANLMGATPTSIVRIGLYNLGRLFTIDQRLTFDEASSVAKEFGFVARREAI